MLVEFPGSLPKLTIAANRIVVFKQHITGCVDMFLLHWCEAEAQDRGERKLERLLKQSELPEGKTLANLDEAKLQAKVRGVLPALLDGSFVTRADNVIALGLPSRGKSHFLAALGRELVLRHKYAVLFTPTFKLVQRLLVAKRSCSWRACLASWTTSMS
jgi:DNA replication protein DnaC